MKLKCVTITGADDSTDVKDIIDISKNYHFVEWGILFSPTRNAEKEPRYPSHDWVKEFLNAAYQSPVRVNKSAHLCGKYTSEFLETGKKELIDKDFNLLGWFDRWQMNFNATKNWPHPDFIKWLGTDNIVSTRKPIILQLNDNNKFVTDQIINKSKHDGTDLPKIVYPPFYHHIQFLYDASGGTGKEIENIHPVIERHLTGYAGGLNPKNLQDALDKIIVANYAGHSELVSESLEPEIWIDTESGVRSLTGDSVTKYDDKLDLNKVVEFLEIAKPYTM